jgi:hypothetical protein
VTSLEPRTPHQPEKLQKLSKNDSVFTPSDISVNEKPAPATTFVFNRVHAVHSPVTGNSAEHTHNFPQNPRWTRLSA